MSFIPNQRPVAPWSFHHWWGQWDTATQLPSVTGSATQLYAELQAGDLAWVVDDEALYVCIDPTANAAVWTALTGGGGGIDSVSGTSPISVTAGPDPVVSIDPASETVPGSIELATQAEVDAGVDAERAVTPATLAGKLFTPTGATFYAQMPGDNAATIAAGAPVLFPSDGPAYGPTPPVSTTTSAFTVPTAGTYLISFQLSVNEAAAAEVWGGAAGLTRIPQSTARRATGTNEITNTFLATLVANTILSVRNPAGQATVLTLTPAAGGEAAQPTTATFTIVRVG